MANSSFTGAIRTKNGLKHYSVHATSGTETEIEIVNSSGALIIPTTAIVNGSTLSADGDEINALQVDTKATILEDFHGTWTDTETLNADMWVTTAGSGTANEKATTVAASLNGEVTITSSSANASSAADASNITGINLAYKANQGGLAMEARLHIDDIVNGYIFVGFTDVIGTTVERPIFLTTTAIDSDATNACGVCFDSGGTTEEWFHGGVKAGTDTTPAYSGTAPVNGTYVVLRVEVSAAGAVQGFVNGTAIGVAVAAATTITTAMTPAVVVSNSTGNAIVMTLDYIWTQQNR
jgi:hypothetical protein